MSHYQELLQELRPQYRAFVAAYVKEPVASKAAIAAGYSEKSAESKGSQLLRIVKVKEAIDAGLEEVAEKSQLRAVDLAKMLYEDYLTCRTRVPKTDFSGEQVVDEGGRPVWKLQDAVGAKAFSDMLMKHIGGYEKDKKFEGNINIGWEDNEDGD